MSVRDKRFQNVDRRGAGLGANIDGCGVTQQGHQPFRLAVKSYGMMPRHIFGYFGLHDFGSTNTASQ